MLHIAEQNASGRYSQPGLFSPVQRAPADRMLGMDRSNGDDVDSGRLRTAPEVDNTFLCGKKIRLVRG